MGPSPFHPKQKTNSINEHFLSLTICPDNNKMFAQVYVPSTITLSKWASGLIKAAQIQSQSILFPKQYKVIEKSACGEGLTVEIEFECYYIPLSHQISKRCQCEKYLEEAQMWYLLYSLTQSAVSSRKIGERLGDLSPQNILLSKSGKVKVISKLSVPNYCDQIIDNRKKNVFLSPQELEILKKSLKVCPLDYVLAESFSIGMIVLSAGTLQDLLKCYDYKQFQINKIQFNKILNFWQQNQFYSQLQKSKTHYSDQLRSLVFGLLQINPLKRKTFQQVHELLEPHMLSILRMQTFDLSSRNLSPIHKLDSNRLKDKNEAIHILRSRKKQQIQLSPMKPQQNSIVQPKSPQLGLQFSFRSPEPSSRKKAQGSIIRTQKLKLTSSNFMKNQSVSK